MLLPESGRVLWSALLATLFACSDADAQGFTGHWTYHEGAETAELDVSPPAAGGHVTGTLVLPGMRAPMSGTIAGGVLTIESVNGVSVAEKVGAIAARMRGRQLMLVIAKSDAMPVTIAMDRGGLGSGAAAAVAGGPPAADQLRRGMAASGPDPFLGEWQTAAPDGTAGEALEFERSGDGVAGALRVWEHGYFSGRTTVKQQLSLEGSVGRTGLALTMTDQESGNRFPATAERQGDYLIIRIGSDETAYARDGVSLVRDASGARGAAALEQAIRGNIYVASTQASGRGAFVGRRTRLALCSNGEIQFGTSDLATTGGADAVDFGGSTSRRGGWEIVLYAGVPAVHAHWQGTGTSYSLDRYFRIVPGAAGRSITLDGTPLPLEGHC
jgi:hypothetical protein